MNYQESVQMACKQVGTQAALAKAIDVSPAIVQQWRVGARPVPVKHCLAIERATHGAVTRRDLRPDDWHLIWPELARAGQSAQSNGCDSIHCHSFTATVNRFRSRFASRCTVAPTTVFSRSSRHLPISPAWLSLAGSALQSAP